MSLEGQFLNFTTYNIKIGAENYVNVAHIEQLIGPFFAQTLDQQIFLYFCLNFEMMSAKFHL